MAIGDRIQSAVEALAANRIEDSLLQLGAAMDATAHAETGIQGGAAHRAFLEDNTGLITKFGMGVRINKMALGYSHPHIKTDDNGVCPMSEILYRAVRCGLSHDARLPENIVFHDLNQIEAGSPLRLPKRLIHGMIIATVTAPSNAQAQCNENSIVKLDGIPFAVRLNSLWGRRVELEWLMESVLSIDECHATAGDSPERSEETKKESADVKISGRFALNG